MGNRFSLNMDFDMDLDESDVLPQRQQPAPATLPVVSGPDPNVLFYRNEVPSKGGEGLGVQGELCDNIHANWDGKWQLLETHHAYIQWLFPTFEQSRYNYGAEALTKEGAAMIRADAECCRRVLRSYRLMLRFYGFVLADETTGRIELDANPKERLDNLNESAHNWQRISRILTSLGQLGFARYKKPLLERLETEVRGGSIGRAAGACEEFWAPLVRGEGQPWYVARTGEDAADREECCLFRPELYTLGPDGHGLSLVDRMDHLVKAGAEDRELALRELEAGQKRGHWIWWAFPTLAVRGGGQHPGAELASVAEAREYARHPILRSALLTQFQTLTRAMAKHGKQAPWAVLDAGFGRSADGEWVDGPVDSFKVFCCATLFAVLAHEAGDDALRAAALAVLERFTGDVVYSAAGEGTSGYLDGASSQRFVLQGADGPTLQLLGQPDWEAVVRRGAAKPKASKKGSFLFGRKGETKP